MFEVLLIIGAALIFVVIVRKIPVKGNVPAKQIAIPIKKINSKKGLIKMWNKIKSILLNMKVKKSQPKLSDFDYLFSKNKPPLKSEKYQDSVFGLEKKADDFLRQGNLGEAEKLYLQIAAKNPKHPKIYNRLGIIYLQQKQFADSRDAFLEAIKQDGGVASRHYNLGLAYKALGADQKAKVEFRKALDLDKNNKKYSDALE